MTVAQVASDVDKPRVISELKKSNFPKRRLAASSSLDDDSRPKIAGELLWSATPIQWHVKLAEVRHGSLVVHCSSTGAAEFRLPLHHLNLLSGRSTPRTFTLATGHGIPLATFQTLTEDEYERWVRVLAVEVLRQTPLQDVRFLDIIGITRGKEGLRRGRSEECLTTSHRQTGDPPTPPAVVPGQKAQRNKYNFKEEGKKRKKEKTEFSQWLHCVKRETEEEKRTKNMDFDMKNMKIRRAQKVRPKLPFADTWNKLRGHSGIGKKQEKEPYTLEIRSASVDDLRKHQTPAEPMSLCSCTEEKPPVSDESGISSGDENNNTVSDTSTKSEYLPAADSTYVSVREKKKFFESLSGEPKKIEVHLNRSSSIGNIDVGPQLPLPPLRHGQRASSMHDLSGNAVPVKAMRRFFEGGLDLTKSVDELRFREDDAGSTIVEEDEGSSENSGTEGSKVAKGPELSSKPMNKSFVNPIERKPKESVCYANIQFSQPTNSARVLTERHVRVRVKEPLVKEQKTSQYLKSNCEEGRQDLNQKLICTMKTAGAYHRNVPKIVEQETFSRSMSETGSTSCDNLRDMSSLLAQRKLQRGERKLGKLRIQIAEVEETIKNIAEDLHSIGPDTLKRRAGLEVFAALRRRLEEETSRLERLQEETAKVISDNQRTILRMGPTWPAPISNNGVLV